MATFSLWGPNRPGTPPSKARRQRSLNMAQVLGQALSRNQTQTFLGVVAFLLAGYLLLSSIAPLGGSTNEAVVGEPVFGVMFDAGSSGSRVHVYKFLKRGVDLELQDELFEQISPGLSAFAKSEKDILESADKNIKPLLEKAMAAVPKQYQKATPVVLRATAGLRKIGETDANRLLEQCRMLFRKGPFLFKDEWVSIMDGLDEGAYAWVTVNYLRKLLGKSPAETYGVLDLGGGSTQIAFAVTADEAKMSPNYVQVRKFGATTYNIYINSYLGYGLNEARTSIFNNSVVAPADANAKGVCLPPAFQGHWQTIELMAHANAVAAKPEIQPSCARHVLKSLFQPVQCEMDRCAIAGVPQPRVDTRQFHAFSFYYDRAVDLGLLKDDDHGAELNPRHFKEAARTVCPLSETEIKAKYQVTKEADVPFQCVDHTYIYSLLHGLGFADDSRLMLTKKINGIETGWCLGATIQELMNLN